MLEKEKRIKDQRYIDASRKDLLGMEGKLGVILKNIGEPLVDHGGSNSSLGLNCTYMQDVYEEDHANEIPEMDEDEEFTQIGIMFDALSKGYNLTIQFLEDEKILTVTYKGILVYQEIENDLERYIPLKEWEDIIEYFYKKAKEKLIENKEKYLKEKGKTEETRRLKFLNDILIKWGIKIK